MKKQFKLILCVALVLMLLAVLGIAVSAAEVTTEAEANYKVVAADSTTIGYYTVLQEAVAAVTDGGKVVVLRDVAGEAGFDLSKSKGFSYTITGGDTRRSLNFTSGYNSKYLFYLGSSSSTMGSVTFDNLALTHDISTLTDMVFCTGKSATKTTDTLTLHSVVAEFSTARLVWLYRTYNLVISGDTTHLSATDVVWGNTGAAGAAVSITDGTLNGCVRLAAAATLDMTGGTLNGYFKLQQQEGFRYYDANGKIVYWHEEEITHQDTYTKAAFASMITVTVGGNATVNAGENPIAAFSSPSTLVIESGATLRSSVSGIFTFTDACTWTTGTTPTVFAEPSVVINGGTLYTGVCPAVEDVDFTKLNLVLPGVSSVDISTVMTIDAFEDLHELAIAQVAASIDKTKFASVSIEDVSGWVPINVLAGGDVTVNLSIDWQNTAYPFVVNGGKLSFAGGSYTTTAARLVNVIGAGEVLVKNGSFAVTAEKPYLFYFGFNSTAVLTVEAGTFQADCLIYLAGAATATVNGGTFTGGEADNGLYYMRMSGGGSSLTVNGGTFTVGAGSGGIFCLNSATGAPTGIRTLHVKGGSFDGSARWIFVNQPAAITLENASFTDVNNYLPESGAIRMRNNATAADVYAVTLTIRSGSFTTNAASHAPIIWLEEECVVIEGGTFRAERLAKLDYVGELASFTVNGGTYFISGDKAIQAYHAGSAKFDLAINGGMFIMTHESAMLVNRADVVGVNNATFKSFSVSAVTVLARSPMAVLWDDETVEGIYPALVQYSGGSYYIYHKATATDTALDVSNADVDYTGAAVHIAATTDGSGIRFTTVLSEAVIETLQGMTDKTLQFGTLIAPADYVTAAGSFTVEALERLTVAGVKYVDIPAVKSVVDKDEDGIPEAYAGALVNLKLKNYPRVFAAVSYVKVDGVIYYGAYDMMSNARSVEQVAEAALAAGNWETDTELTLLKAYAGYTPQSENVVEVAFSAGRVDTATGTVVAAAGYFTSEVIHLTKAGTIVIFADQDGSFAGSDTYVVSHWTADGTALAEPYDNYEGEGGRAAEVAVTLGGERYYAYISTYDNEYIRLCYTGEVGDTTVSVREANKQGTLAANETAYAAYIRALFLLESKSDVYYEQLEGLNFVTIGTSVFDIPAIKGNLWVDLIADKYGMTFENHGVSGSTIANDKRELPTTHSSYKVGSTRAANSFVERVDNPDAKKGFAQVQNYDVDIVFFAGGGNDLTRGIAIGEVSLDNTDTTTLCGAINYCIKKLQWLYPNALIISNTNTPYNAKYTFDFTPGEEAYAITRAEYSAAKTALLDMWGIVSYNAMDESVTGGDINSEWYREQYYMDPNDTNHRNVEGQKQWMPIMEKFMAEQYAAYLEEKAASED